MTEFGLKPETIEYLKRRAGRAPMLGRSSLRGRSSQMLHRHGGPNRMKAMGRARLYLAKAFPEALVLSIIEKRKQPIIFGLTGPSGVGKTEIIKHLMDEHGFVSTHAGRPVKKALRKGFKLKNSQVDGKHKRDAAEQLGGMDPKMVLDHVGEAIARQAPNATAIALGHKIDKMKRQHSAIVVDGVRQQAEADLIHRRGGHMIRVDDGGGPDPKYPMDKRAARLKVDHHIDTSGTLEQSYEQTRKIVDHVKANSPAHVGKDMGADDVHVPTAIGNDRRRQPRRAKYPQLSLAAVPVQKDWDKWNEEHRGSKSKRTVLRRTLRGARNGALAGGLAGAALGARIAPNFSNPMSRKLGAFAGGVLGAGYGAGAGAAYGASFGKRSAEPVQKDWSKWNAEHKGQKEGSGHAQGALTAVAGAVGGALGTAVGRHEEITWRPEHVGWLAGRPVGSAYGRVKARLTLGKKPISPGGNVTLHPKLRLIRAQHELSALMGRLRGGGIGQSIGRNAPALVLGSLAAYGAARGASSLIGGDHLGKDGGQDKVHQVMHEYKHGRLHSGSKTGPKVRSRAQAIAIALNQAGLSNQ